MSEQTYNRLCPARPSEVKILGDSLVDQLLKVEDEMQGPEQFRAKKEIIAHFEKHEPDLFSFFQSKVISPYQFLVKVQKAFEKQSDVTFDGHLISKSDAVLTLQRYIPNLQYLHDNQLYTRADSLKELGTAIALGVVATGVAEAIGRQRVSNPFLSMEMAVALTAGVALVLFLWFVLRRNRNFFHKAPWNSAIYLGANLHETDPGNWRRITWQEMEKFSSPFEGFTIMKNRPHYQKLDNLYSNSKKHS